MTTTPTNAQQLPYNVPPGDSQASANARATQQIFMSQPRIQYLEVEGAYTEPMIIGVGPLKPLSIVLETLSDSRAPAAPCLSGGMVYWQYKPTLGGAEISSIDGLTPLTGARYSFVFRITFRAQV